jgi:hypothetical protein
MLLLVRGMSTLCSQLGSKLTALLKCTVWITLQTIRQSQAQRTFFETTYAAALIA